MYSRKQETSKRSIRLVSCTGNGIWHTMEISNCHCFDGTEDYTAFVLVHDIFVFLVNVPLMYVIASDVIELTLRKWHAYQWHNQKLII